MKSKKEQFELKAMEWANNRCVNWMMLFDGGELGWLFLSWHGKWRSTWFAKDEVIDLSKENSNGD